jgi:hypothetical protein
MLCRTFSPMSSVLMFNILMATMWCVISCSATAHRRSAGG